MIARLITKFFNFLLDCIMGIIRLICIPLNALFTGIFPDLSTHITNINNALDYAFNGLSWALNIIPPGVRTAMLLCFTIELSMLLVMRSAHLTAKAWKILQKLKFW